jgi:hypothetical protein
VVVVGYEEWPGREEDEGGDVRDAGGDDESEVWDIIGDAMRSDRNLRQSAKSLFLPVIFHRERANA